MENIQKLVLEWAHERNLITPDNSFKQALKLVEETGELASAIIKNDTDEIIDAIGDIQVVLIILSEQLGIDYNKSLESAYDVIKYRKGKTVNGVFIKE